jgi:flagellar biosynthesis chaperone FliJ
MAGAAQAGRAGLRAFSPPVQRFRFNLASVKDVRKQDEDAAMRALADRMAAARAAQAAAERSLASHRAAQERLRAPSGSAALLVQADRDRDTARVRLDASARQLEERRHGVDRARGDLVRASQALEALERLEAKRRAEHEQAAIAAEERVVAEIVEARAARAAVERRRARRRAA